ncbi:MAG: oligopeptide/dipeptide ABC transporter ATP-binding protein, partial [Pseudomonadota bacterium]
VERVSHAVGVMYLGRIVELGPRQAIFEDPQHPYTKSLLKAVPVADPRQRKGEKELNFKPIPSPIHPLDYSPAPSVYDEVAPGHLVLRET